VCAVDARALAVRGFRPAPERPAFADVAAAEIGAVYRYLLALTRDAALADDLTSATFERALREWRRFDPVRGRPRPWLIEIARRLALDHFRAERRRRGREERAAPPEAQEAVTPGGLSPALRAALAGLPNAEREVVALRVLLDLENGEVARLLGMTPSAVSTALHRALGRLRAGLGEGWRQ